MYVYCVGVSFLCVNFKKYFLYVYIFVFVYVRVCVSVYVEGEGDQLSRIQ